MTALLLADTHGDELPTKRALNTGRKIGAPVVHLGDMGFSYKRFAAAPQTELMLVGGNHDNYSALLGTDSPPCYLGDFGPVPGSSSAFFVRGARSTDREARMEGVDWWREEELESDAMGAALAAYEAMRPAVVLSHDCPESILPHVLCGDRGMRSATGALLEAMLRVHRPEVWYFGHHHRPLLMKEKSTYFRCLESCEILEADL